MLASQRALFGEFLDYAGLFPPARLSLDDAIRNYARYRREPEAWMLARFICPVGRLNELEPYLEGLLRDGPPLRVAALGQGGASSAAFLDNLRGDLEAIGRFRERHHTRVVFECFETRLPGDMVGGGQEGRAHGWLGRAAEVVAAARLGTLPRFFELPLSEDCRSAARSLAVALAALNAERRWAAPEAKDADAGIPGQGKTSPDELGATACAPAGLKLRCGGIEPAAVPSVEQVATVIEECAVAGVPLKFTAGLHQATRRLDPGLGVYVHGFLNVFAAGILASALGLEHDEIVAVVEEEDVRQFQFTEDFFGWNDLEATVSEIEYARRQRVISFGSCSFDEPRAELHTIGLI